MRFPSGPSPLIRFTLLQILGQNSFVSLRLILMLAVLRSGESSVMVGVITALMMVVPLFVALPVGRWTDRAGWRRPAWLGMALVGAGGVLLTLRQSLDGFALGAVLIGTGQSVAQVALMHAMGHAAGDAGVRQAFARLALWFSISGFIGPVIAGLLVDHAGVRAAFLVMALPALGALAWILRTAPEPTATAADAAAAHAQAAAAAAAPSPGLPGQPAPLWRDPVLRPALVAMTLLTLGWDLMTFLMPLHADAMGLSASAIGFISGAFSAGCFAVRLVLGRITAGHAEAKVVWFVLTGTVLCYALFPFGGSGLHLAALAFVLGVFLGVGQPMGMSLLHRSSPPARSGEVMGMRIRIISVSQIALPLAFGVLGGSVGTAPAFWLATAVIAAGVAYGRRG